MKKKEKGATNKRIFTKTHRQHPKIVADGDAQPVSFPGVF